MPKFTKKRRNGKLSSKEMKAEKRQESANKEACVKLLNVRIQNELTDADRTPFAGHKRHKSLRAMF